MMMQHDTGPMPPNVLAHETVDAVRRALQRYVVAASAIVKNGRHIRALRVLRQGPSAELAAAAVGVAPAGRVYLLADARPFAVCVGLWRPAIYVSSGLVGSVSPAGLRAALAHEEAHRR